MKTQTQKDYMITKALVNTLQDEHNIWMDSNTDLFSINSSEYREQKIQSRKEIGLDKALSVCLQAENNLLDWGLSIALPLIKDEKMKKDMTKTFSNQCIDVREKLIEMTMKVDVDKKS